MMRLRAARSKAAAPGRSSLTPARPRAAAFTRGSEATNGRPMAVPIETPQYPTALSSTHSSPCTASSVAFHSSTARELRAANAVISSAVMFMIRRRRSSRLTVG